MKVSNIIWIVAIGLQAFFRKSNGIDLKECKRKGDYLWKKSSPEQFYYCHMRGQAMPMTCYDGTKMCRLPGKTFTPCMCPKNGDEPKPYIDNCDEKFRRMPNRYREGGEQITSGKSIEECEKNCLKAVNCLGFDYYTTSLECRVFWPDVVQAELQPMLGVDHYVKKPCALQKGEHIQGDASSDENEVEGKEGTENEVPGEQFGNEYSTAVTTTQSSSSPGPTTIPDSGCPYGLKKYEGISQRGSIPLKDITDIENCKSWCINLGYCKGIDFNTKENKCSFHTVIEKSETKPDPDIIHIRKEECSAPLKCWSQISYNSTNVDIETPQIPCKGVCFVREKIFSKYTVFERGCHESKPIHKVGCVVDGSLTGISCFCDTDRCNGLSILAQAAVMLHLPLDGDGRDSSGLGRDGQPPIGFRMPETSCLEKVVNCSMVFTGQECIEVPQMASQAWGDVNLDNEFTAMYSLALWFKQMPTDNPEIQGIAGNSVDLDTDPTWAIQTSNISQNVITAGINTRETDAFKPDFPYIVAKTDEWHHLVVTYDSTMDTEKDIYPIMKVVLDGKEVPGNMHNDMGNILVRRQPVTVGCVKGKAFKGFIDDVRIFAMALDQTDIEALRQMKDTLYH